MTIGVAAMDSAWAASEGVVSGAGSRSSSTVSSIRIWPRRNAPSSVTNAVVTTSPQTRPEAADFQFLSGDIAAHRARHDDRVGAHVLAGDASRLADDQHAAQGDLAFERALDADAARAVDGAVPDHARAKHRGDALDGLDEVVGVRWGWCCV